ncbi:MAG: hypothetical protein LBD11_08055 [Candidatus Peribacteria bacterium]|jgi:hypothetical protein|nr:hypothetical protein [Candidatus Peribacteria bacterium]
MRQSSYGISTFKRISKYLLRVIIILWVIVSFIMGYFYLLDTGSQISKKGGTFVEGIFDQVSYLPYLKNDAQSSFYQSILFRSCLNPYEKGEDGIFTQDLCKVRTEDNQNYSVRLIDNTAQRNDGLIISIEDIFFTYDEIIRQNKRGIQSLNIWNTVVVSLEDGKVNVTFPTATPDNANFFTNTILPKHVLGNASLDQYRNDFSLAPVRNTCANILSQNKDTNSLIFDLNKCENTNFAYYQIKNYGDFEKFEAGQQGKTSIVDVYESPYTIEGFTGKNILTSKLMGIFFNTDSDKVKVRLRRSLGGLIYSNFYTGKYENYLKAYDGIFLNYFISEGENVQDLISRVNLSDSEINQQDLKDSGAKELPESISVNGVDRKFIFFLQKPESSRDLEIKFSNEFENIKITAPDGTVRSPKNYKSKDKKVTYTLTTNKNLKVGSNQYTVQGTIRGKTYTILSFDLYVFENLGATKNEENQRKLNILYYSEPTSIFIAQQMRKILKETGILENFIFEECYNPEELEGKLLMGSYDLYIGSVDLGSKKDLLALFATENALSNPSRYRNPILSSLIKQYNKTPNQSIIAQINQISAQDMPIVLLGTAYTPLQMKEAIAENVFPNQSALPADDRRYQIYTNYSIVHNVRIDTSKAMQRENFVNFISNNLQIQRTKKIENPENPFEGLIQAIDENLSDKSPSKETPTEENTEI